MSNNHKNHSSEGYVNPFDDEQHQFVVLQNSQQQYSLWPVFAAQPQGWNKVFGPQQRAVCIAYIEQHWLSINPFKAQ